MEGRDMREVYVCIVCGFIIGSETGLTDLHDDWICPVCGANKRKLKLYPEI